MSKPIHMAVVAWKLEPQFCDLCREEGGGRRATTRVEVTLWHGAHGRTTNYLCCDDHAKTWGETMEGVAMRIRTDA
jgi:hypothetical protein